MGAQLDDDVRIDAFTINPLGVMVIAECSEDRTHLKILAPDGDFGVPDAEHDLPFESSTIVPEGDDEFLCISARGEVAQVGSRVQLREEMPLRHGNAHLLRRGVSVGGRVYVASMSGELLLRSRGEWKTVCKGFDFPVAHVWAIGGDAEGLYAVGSHVWRLDGKDWARTNAPSGPYTTLTFHRGELVTFRQKSLVRGTDDGEWLEETLDLRREIDDVCSFDGELYVAADGVLHTLSDGGLRLEAEARPCRSLATNGDVLLAATEHELHALCAGRWNRIW
jgi:hypothetical protein